MPARSALLPASGTSPRPSRRSPVVAAAGAGLLAPILLAGTLATAPTAAATSKVKCDASGSPTVAVGRYDPIVSHNRKGAMHEHQFFGNKSWLKLRNPNTANYGDLAGHKTNCRVSHDKAGYWMPTLRYISGPKKGKLIPAQQFTAYYRPGYGLGKDFGPALAFPADTRLVSSPRYAAWTCGEKSGARSKPVNAIPNCTGLSGQPGLTLTAHIDLPNCWDGVMPHHSRGQVGDTRDNRHYAYAVNHRCPAKFPKMMTHIRETVQFPYVGNGRDVALTSDKMAGTSDGRSLHGDFWNTWDQEFFNKTFLQRCVRNASLFTAKMCEP